MKSPFIRLQEISVKNLKNVESGTIEIENIDDDYDDENIKAKIIGIYGQNGSGKTTLIDAYNFLKKSIEGVALPKDLYNYINLSSNNAELEFKFYIKSTAGNKYKVNYYLLLEKIEDENKAIIKKEKISYSKKESEKWTYLNTLVEYQYDYKNDELSLLPFNKFDKSIFENKKDSVNLEVNQKVSIYENTSFLFNEKVKKFLIEKNNKPEFKEIIESLTYFAKCNLFVIMNDYTGVINMNAVLPFVFRIEHEDSIASGDIALSLNSSSLIPKELYNILNKIIVQMNIVLKRIVPLLEIELFDYGDELDKDGNIQKKVELLFIKEDKKLPLKYESEGIKKIISILSTLIAMYNNPSVSLIVDELDSGIYEFLLGEILKVVEKDGKGQLIFTSHNLRPLEILNKDNLYFTTTNSKNRYIKLINIKPNNNLRSLYIRSIILGGQKEDLYNETDDVEIQRAFRLAGDEYGKI